MQYVIVETLTKFYAASKNRCFHPPNFHLLFHYESPSLRLLHEMAFIVIAEFIVPQKRGSDATPNSLYVWKGDNLSCFWKYLISISPNSFTHWFVIIICNISYSQISAFVSNLYAHTNFDGSSGMFLL